jgi:putative endonuclease
MYHVYILKLKDNSYYTGSTSDLEKRLLNHKNGRVKSTKNKRPCQLIHEESYSNRSKAQTREYRIKGWKSRLAIERLIKKE